MGRCLPCLALALATVVSPACHDEGVVQVHSLKFTGVKGIDESALKSALATSFTDARPLAHNAFKVELAQRVALRALQTAGARA